MSLTRDLLKTEVGVWLVRPWSVHECSAVCMGRFKCTCPKASSNKTFKLAVVYKKREKKNLRQVLLVGVAKLPGLFLLFVCKWVVSVIMSRGVSTIQGLLIY